MIITQKAQSSNLITEYGRSIGLLFLAPYISTTDAELYGHVRERALSLDSGLSNELLGF
jgi:hypothetical protein